jgi:flavin-dependent dehydrogenase
VTIAQLNATIDVTAAAARAWDVVVLGAGPAGSGAAREAARSGWSVLLVDRAAFPRDKVCGCCVSAAGRRVLADAGLDDVLAGASPLDRFELRAGGRRAVLRPPASAALDRGTLDTRLARHAIDAGAAFLPATAARVLGVAHGLRRVALGPGPGPVATARLVVAADGQRGLARAAARRAGRIGVSVILDAATAGPAPGTLAMACGRDGFVGMVRLPDGRLDVAGSVRADAMRDHGRTLAAIIEEAGGRVPPGLEDARMRGTPLLRARPRRVHDDRLIVAGDAAGYVDPFTGEGIGWAIATGRAAGRTADACLRHDRPTAAWSTEHRRLVARRHRACGRVARLLRHPRATTLAVALLARMPALATPIVRGIDRPLEVPS